MPAPAGGPPALRFNNVSKTYRAGQFRALDGVSFDIQPGEFFGLLGPNGAGKTSLISILAGLSRASGGDVSVLGHDVVDDYANARKKLGIVPQELVFDPFFSVRETLRIQSGYFGVRNNDDWIDELLHNLGLSDKAHNNMRQLSGGMKRRVLVAQALVHRPPVIVLDEPTAGVDVELRQTLWQFIARLNREGHTVLLTTHYLEEAEHLCRNLAIINHGQIVTQGPMRELLAKLDVEGFLFDIDGELPAQLPVIEGTTMTAIDGHTLDVDMPRAMDLNRVFAALNASGIRVRSMRTKSNRLEELFVRLTGNQENAA